MREELGTELRVPETFEDFYEREYARIVALALTLSGSRSGAEDLAQEAFLAAHRRWGEIASFDRPDAWVRRVVANRAMSQLRRRVAELKALSRLGRAPVVAELPPSSDEFWAEVRALPRRQAQVLALHYLEDLPVAEIGKILGLATGTVTAHLHAGRAALARRLQTEDER
jgi:RNA polymerase sigma-70 factor (ECF subfamily)